MISVAQAQAILASSIGPVDTEEIPLEEGIHRILARDVVSDVDWPPFETSAMDGYAVRLGDVPRAGASVSERPEVVAAGNAEPPPLLPGEGVRVMTGAPLPAGTEAVVPVEQAQSGSPDSGFSGSPRVRFSTVPAAGAHIRRRGESVLAGAHLLPAGRRLTAADIALAALAGADPLRVYRRPRVGVAATGNELVAPSEKPPAGHLRDSNGPMLFSLCRARGCAVEMHPRVPDDAVQVEALFSSAGEGEDLLLTSGGVSAGDLDLLPKIARQCGFEILFHGVSVRPGKPIIFARRGKTLWFGLPGNPVSSSVGFHIFVRLALDHLEGSSRPGAPRVTARLTRELTCGARETFRDALLADENGENSVEPLFSAGSHDIASHARANALIRLPAGSGKIPAGTKVECLML